MIGSPPDAIGSSGADLPAANAPRQPRWTTTLFWVVVLGLLPLMVIASHDFGMTWDEQDRHENGRLILEYFEGKRGRDDAQWGTIYPGLFDVIPAWLERQSSTNRQVLRHRVNAVFGWLGILFAGLLAGRLFGPWSAILAAVLLAASPRYFAHSMNNPKDLPFAAMSVVVLYCLSMLRPRWPYLTAAAGAAVAVALGLALGTRPGALLYFGYLPLLVLALVAGHRLRTAGGLRGIDRRIHWSAAAQLTVRVAAVLVGGLLLGTIFWPWAQAQPFFRPFEALSTAGGYDFPGPVVFDGEDNLASELPWSYLPTWLLIATPPVVLAGMVLSIAAPVRGWGWSRLALWSAALLPLALIVMRDAIVYDGMRHILFVYPAMVVLAASGWTAVLRSRSRWLRAGAVALLIPGLVTVLAFHVRSYPNQAAYVNELVGGPRGAFGRYELDYWGNCMLQAVAWSADAATRADMPVTIWGWPWHIISADAARFPHVTVAKSRTDPHHLELQLGRSLIRDVRRLAARRDAVHRVTTHDGAVLCAVFPGPDFEALRPRLRAARRPSS